MYFCNLVNLSAVSLLARNGRVSAIQLNHWELLQSMRLVHGVGGWKKLNTRGAMQIKIRGGVKCQCDAMRKVQSAKCKVRNTKCRCKCKFECNKFLYPSPTFFLSSPSSSPASVYLSAWCYHLCKHSGGALMMIGVGILEGAKILGGVDDDRRKNPGGRWFWRVIKAMMIPVVAGILALDSGSEAGQSFEVLRYQFSLGL